MWKTKIGRCIYTSPSGYKVYQNYWYRWLTFGGTEYQTLLNRKKPYRPELSYLLPLSMMARDLKGSCCILGLGGGALLHLLNHYQLKKEMTVIESCQEVIDIAKLYFQVAEIHNLRIIHQDAIAYLKESTDLFDHLIIDIYGAASFPEHCLNSEFFTLCQKHLSEEGILAINIANAKEHRPIFDLINELFKYNTVIIPAKTSSNMIIIASNSFDKDVFIEKIRHSKEIKQLRWVNSWGHVASY